MNRRVLIESGVQEIDDTLLVSERLVDLEDLGSEFGAAVTRPLHMASVLKTSRSTPMLGWQRSDQFFPAHFVRCRCALSRR